MKSIEANHYIIDVSLNKNIKAKGYPFTLPVVKNLSKLTFHPNVTFLVGENGAGKSTLVEAIAVSLGLNAEGGTKNFNFSTAATHSNLHEYISVTKGINRPKDSFFLRAETFYNVASEIDNLELENTGAYGNKSLHKLSHGESFISLIENRFRGNGLYILDEPEAALSPSNQLKLLVLIDKLVKLNSQFIIATHSPIIMAYPNADIYVVGSDSITKTQYEDTDHYQITKYFLNSKDKVLGELLV